MFASTAPTSLPISVIEQRAPIHYMPSPFYKPSSSCAFNRLKISFYFYPALHIPILADFVFIKGIIGFKDVLLMILVINNMLKLIDVI